MNVFKNLNVKERLKAFAPNYTFHLIRRFMPKDCKSLLDIGCGKNSAVRLIDKKIYKTGVDIYEPDLAVAQTNQTHNEYLLINVLDIDKYFDNKSYDCVVAIGLVEHLHKKDALSLIDKMEKIAKKTVIIETPSGFVRKSEVDGNIYQKHLCGFTAIEFRNKGYKVLGKDAMRFLRVGGDGNGKDVNIFMAVLATIAEPFYRKFPEHCLNLFAYKNLKQDKITTIEGG